MLRPIVRFDVPHTVMLLCMRGVWGVQGYFPSLMKKLGQASYKLWLLGLLNESKFGVM